MSNQRKILIALFVVAAGVAIAALLASSRTQGADPASHSTITDERVAFFQSEADKACLCTRRSGVKAKDSCWANYERLVAPLKPKRLGTLCIGANYWDYLPDEKIVTLQRAGDACTSKEELVQLAQWRREGVIEAESEGCD